MYKLKTTKTELNRDRFNTFSCGYCGLTYLLYFETPIAYTCGIYGWNGDVYTFDGGFTIHTGYRQLAGKKLYLVNEYNNAARKIVENNLLTFQEKRHLVRCLLQRFKVAQYSIYATDKNNVDKLISVYRRDLNNRPGCDADMHRKE